MDDFKKNLMYVVEEKPEVAPKEEKVVKEPTIKLNKFDKVVLYILITYFIIVVLLLLFQFVNSDFSNYMWININNRISDFKFNIMQNFPSLSSYGSIIIFIIYVVLLIIFVSLYLIFAKDVKKRNILIHIFLPIIGVLLVITMSNYYYILSNESHRGINEIYMKDNLKSSYNKENLENVIDYFKSRIITYAESLNRKNGKIIVNKEPLDMAIEDLKNLSIKYEFLNGSYPSKIRALNNNDLKLFNEPDGLTYNYTVGLDEINLTSLNKINVLTHELCHVKGVSRESDAEYCAFLAGYNSNNDVSKYSMYLNVILNLLGALDDEKACDNVINEFGSICMESGYDELCNLYSKDLHRFVDGSDTINLYTYSLDVYKNNKEELKQYLVGLKNRFNVTIATEEDKQITLEEANKLIDEESTHYLFISGNITKKLFDDNTKYLNTIAYYFPYLYLSDSKDEEDYDDNFDYLKPFPTSSFVTLTEKYPEFSYNRSVRSILEYFDKYIFN